MPPPCFKADARLHGSSTKTPFKDAITSKDAGMISLSEACRRAASYASSIETEEEIDVAEAQGRVLPTILTRSWTCHPSMRLQRMAMPSPRLLCQVKKPC